jgi:hypothetical protein
MTASVRKKGVTNPAILTEVYQRAADVPSAKQSCSALFVSTPFDDAPFESFKVEEVLH